jgi:hypothetical protein
MKVNKVFPYKYSYNKSKLLICHDNSLMTRTSPIIIVITLWSILYSDAPIILQLLLMYWEKASKNS